MALQQLLDQRIKAIRKILIAHHEAGAPMASASKGSEREILVREFLEKVLPAPFRFGSGTIIDSVGRQSGALDVVVEFPFLPSFHTPGSAERLYLAESVAFVVEVKSDLSSQFDQVQAGAEKVRLLRRKWKGHLAMDENANVNKIDPSLSRIPFVAVGFRGHSSLGTLKERLEGIAEQKKPDAAFVVESGAYFSPFTGHAGEGEEGLFLLVTDLAYFARNVLSAAPDSAVYLPKQGR